MCDTVHRSKRKLRLESYGERAGAAMKNIEALINDGGEITLGAIGGIDCAATAADGHNSLVMLVRRKGETLNALLRRLDKAISAVRDGGDPIDEINS